MPISALEQLEIIKGTISPPSSSLPQLIRAMSGNHALSFTQNVKDFPTTQTTVETIDGVDTDVESAINTDASSYKRKVLDLCNRVLNDERGIINKIISINISIISDGVNDIDVVKNATDAQWENFLNPYVFEAIEVLARVSASEKAEYDSI